jgi:beta-lactamase regulating signal transducer with metallopeptidase domain
MDTLLDLGLRNAVMATLLALLAAVLIYLWRRPAFAHGLWLLVLLKLLTPPLVPLPIDWPGGDVLRREGEALAEPEPRPPDVAQHPNIVLLEVPPPLQADAALPGLPPPADKPLPPSDPERASPAPSESGLPDWMATVAPFWLAGSLLWFVWMGVQVARFQRLLRYAEPAPLEVQELVRDLAARLGLKRPPSVLLVPGVVSPMLWGVGLRPRLLFPAKLLHQLDRQQQQTLLAHELAHLRRRDHWVRLVEVVVLGLYWWHPIVWWARGQLHEAEEQCCDAWVVGTLQGGARSYALALLQTVAFLSRAPSPLPVTASGIGQVPHLRRRLTMIMQGTTPRSLSRAGGIALLGLGLLLLPLLPSDAQTPVKEKPDLPQTPRDPRDQQIEALKLAIKVLEAQKAAEKHRVEEDKALRNKILEKRAADVLQARKEQAQIADQKAKQKATEAQVHQLRVQAEDLKAVYEAKHKELQIIGEKYHNVLMKLRELQPDTKGVPDLKSSPYARPENVPLHVVPADPTKGEPKPAPKFYQPGQPEKMPYRVIPSDEPIGPKLEKRIEQLQRQVEELRREIRRGQPKKTSEEPRTDYNRDPEKKGILRVQ